MYQKKEKKYDAGPSCAAPVTDSFRGSYSTVKKGKDLADKNAARKQPASDVYGTTSTFKPKKSTNSNRQSLVHKAVDSADALYVESASYQGEGESDVVYSTLPVLATGLATSEHATFDDGVIYTDLELASSDASGSPRTNDTDDTGKGGGEHAAPSSRVTYTAIPPLHPSSGVDSVGDDMYDDFGMADDGFSSDEDADAAQELHVGAMSKSGWLHMTVSSRAEAESILLAQPADGSKLRFLVRPRPGKARTHALSMLVRGKTSHHLLEQHGAGGLFMLNGKPVDAATTLEAVVPVVSAQLARRYKCTAAPVAVIVDTAAASQC